jgi:hypothetical protein
MVEVEKALAETHAHYSNGAEKHAESEEEVHRTSNDPIARIGEVREGSPAEKAVSHF